MNHTDVQIGLWPQIMQDMKRQKKLGEVAFKSFLSQLILKNDTGSTLVFEYPSGMMIEWVENHYLDAMKESAARVLCAARQIEFEEQGSSTADPRKQHSETATKAARQASLPSPAPAKPRRKARKKAYINSGLNESLNFDNFVAGASNSFAVGVAKAIAQGTQVRFNPFYIHGASGLGKTHLLHAIGNALRETNEDLCVLYVTCEDFANSYIDALGSRREEKSEAIREFRRKYRQADVLLIDDVQFLAKRQKTQEEFFYTYDALAATGKQIVMTADRPAHEIKDLDKRLATRFEQGLSAMIDAPSYETRLDILRCMRSKWNAKVVGDDVLEFLARSMTRSVSSLEGALTRVASVASFSHRALSVAEARYQLRDLLRDDRGTRATIEDIQRRVAEEFNIRVSDMNGRRRTANIAHPRQIAMFLVRRHTKKSLQDIGAAFGGRDHGTVIHATRTIEEKIEQDSELRARIEKLSALFV